MPDRDGADRRGEKGQALSEYALILAFVLAVCILVVAALAVVVSGQLQAVADLFP